MATQDEPLSLGGMAIPKMTLNRIAAGLKAERQRKALQEKEKRALSRRMQLGGVRGKGLSATAPSAVKAMQVLLNNAFAEQQAEEARQQMQGLGDKVDDATLAQLEMERIKTRQPFEGSGIEAQMLNTMLNPNIPDDDPRKVLARQRLERETTVATPEGTYVRPGYDLSSLGYQQEEKPEQFVKKPTTEGERSAAGFLGRMENAETELSNTERKYPNFDPASTMEFIRGATNMTTSEAMQQYRQAASDWIRAKLRMESGAVIAEEEMEGEYKTYFPVPGDGPKVIAQKRRAREQAIEAMKQKAGRASVDTDNGVDEDAVEGILNGLGV